MKRFLHNNGLSIVLFMLFLFSLGGQYLTGWHEHNEEQRQHGQPRVGAVEYLGEGHFIGAVFENWQSEFLQMAAYIVLTVSLYQKGSSESKAPGRIERVDVIPESARSDPRSPYPVRKGGWLLRLYQNSLSLAFVFLFLLSFAMHAYGGMLNYNQEQTAHGAEAVTFVGHVGTSRFWFESFQNWQSEFLSIALMVVLTIYLRQKGSPESKPVDSPHDETGTS